MRTSYDRGNAPSRKSIENKPEAVSARSENFVSSSDFYEEPVVSKPELMDEQQVVSQLIAKGYAEVKNAMNSKMHVQVDVSQNVNSVRQDGNTGKKKSKKGLVIGIIAGMLVAASAVFSVLVFNGVIPIGTSEPTEPPTEPYELQYSYIADDISKLYENESKTEVATWFTQEDMDLLYARLEDAEDNGENVEDLENELNTISNYRIDVAQLYDLENVNCDISTDSFVESLIRIKVSADNYSVPELKNTIYSRADVLLNMRQEYTRIKMELFSVSSFLSFDKAKYETAIKGVTHVKNSEELTILLAKVDAESGVAKAEAALAVAQYWEEQQAAKKELESAKAIRDEAVKAWLTYTGELVKEPTEVATEETIATEG